MDFEGLKRWQADGMTTNMIAEDLNSCDIVDEDDNISNSHFK